MGVPEGHGWVISSSYQLNDTLLSFLRVGRSNGGAGVAADSSVSLGIEHKPWQERKWSFGIAWSAPSEKTHGADIEDEWVLEMSYNLQITKNFSLMPDIQWVRNPAGLPEESSVYVASLRAIVVL